MATLIVSTTTDFSGDVLVDVDTIDFTNPLISAAATATFASTQFDDDAIKTDVIIDTSLGINNMVVNGGSVDASAWTFITSGELESLTLNGGAAADVMTGSTQKDFINGGVGSDNIQGGDGADVLSGGDNDDTFIYNATAEFETGETIDGGAGTGDTLHVNFNSGLLLNLAPAVTNVEKLTFSSMAALQMSGTQFGTGPGQINAVTGNVGFQLILVSGASIDLSGVTLTSWANAEDAFRLQGTAGDDTLIGSSGDDTLSGFAGTDTLSGGGGDDEVNFGGTSISAGDSIDGGAGSNDSLRMDASGNTDLAAVSIIGIERLLFDTTNGSDVAMAGTQIGAGRITTVVGASLQQDLVVTGAAVNLSGVTFLNWSNGVDTITINGHATAGNTLIGSSQDDTINGGSGNDILDGGAGFNALSGGLGNDTFLLGASGGIVTDAGGVDTWTSTITRTLASVSFENLTLLGNGAANGTGNDVDNVLDGSKNSAGNLLRGLLGNDTYIIGAGDTVDETTGGGTDNVRSLVSHILSAGVENLTLLGATALNATGNDIANIITGNGSANTLDGRGGGDTLRGLGGDDTYVVDNLGDIADESAAGSGGTDTVLSSVNFSLADTVHARGAIESLTLTGNAANGTGDSLANVVMGNAGANTLDGGDGADSLLGDAGNDRLIGGFGPDLLTGGIGADTYEFLALGDSGKKKTARDTLLDFSAEDFIDLTAIDARKGGGDNKFKFIKKQGFHDKKGELHYQKKGSDLVVSGDVNGDGKADFSVLVADLKKLAASDFVL